MHFFADAGMPETQGLRDALHGEREEGRHL